MTETRPKRITKLQDAIFLSIGEEPGGDREAGAFVERYELVRHLAQSGKLPVVHFDICYGRQLMGTVDMREFVAVLSAAGATLPDVMMSAWQPAQAPRKTREPSQAIRDQIREYLKKMATHETGFNCMKMPGQKVDFHAMLACVDTDCLAAKPSTFDGYLKKPTYICAFQKAGRNPAFYECIVKKMGVNPGKYRKTLKKLEAIYEAAKAKSQGGAA